MEKCSDTTCPQCYPTFTNIYNANMNHPRVKAKGAMVGGYSGLAKGVMIGGAVGGPPGALLGGIIGAAAGGKAGHDNPRGAALGFFNFMRSEK